MNISVIIPTLNEEACLPATLDRLCQDRPAEIIVVDGGSTDATPQIAERFGQVLHAPRGRAVQQNLGAKVATGDVLLFLHADCWPEPGWQAAVGHAVTRRGFLAGCFQMHIDGTRWLYRAIERGGDLRVRWLSLPYGDQGIFLRRDTFLRLGGFPKIAFMEDLMFMRRLRRIGRVRQLRHTIHVSARRWEKTGVLSQTMRNWILTMVAVWGGVHPDKLKNLYTVVR